MPQQGHQPYWEAVSESPAFPTLEENITTDVAVVGGGITGITAAMRLRELGRDVAVLEMNRVSGGTTGHSTGHLDHTTDQYLHCIARNFDDAAARRMVAVSGDALDFVELWSRNVGSEFARVPSYLYAESNEDKATVQREWDAVKNMELKAEMPSETPLPFATAASLRIDNQARFAPAAYVRGLARACADAGGAIYEGVRVKEVEDGPPCRLVTSGGIVAANQVIVAVHGAMVGLLSLATRVYPYQSYVLGVRVRNDIPDALFWDTMSPYHYTRWASMEDPHLLIIGGADHRTGEHRATEASFSKLEQYVRERYDVETIEFRWSHEYYEPADGLPYIGRVPGNDRIFTGTGYGGDGLKYGSVAGLLLADITSERYNPAAEVFDPSRVKPLASARRMAAGIGNMARHFIGDRLASSDVGHLHEIPVGAGRVLRIDGRKTAVYHDEDGTFHAMSPVCTHAGCLVNWNATERTWDCPCHGGRYDPYGRVIMAPPRHDLKQLPLPSVVAQD
jgi:glycine/D-amino acid oxidase-like deaminating enzyme/nitrite reductase/ring-hydroxylating ferredoxin subunit